MAGEYCLYPSPVIFDLQLSVLKNKLDIASWELRKLREQAHCIKFVKKIEQIQIIQRVNGSVDCHYSLESLAKLSFKIVSSERIRLSMFSNNY